LLGFSEVRELQLVHAALFLLVYLAALTGNLLIFTVTALDRRLHTPMYFFLRNLSVLDLGLISVIVPKSIHNSLTNNNSIAFLGCITQLFLWIFFAGSEYFVLTAMSYDRYAAICLPLRYEVIMDRGACGKLAAASWLGGGLLGALFSASTFSMSFCGYNVIPQFFCDVPALLKISCSEKHVVMDVIMTIGVVIAVVFFVFIVISYIRIFWAVLRMPAAEGRAKAFSTCLPHLAVVIAFFSTASSAYLKLPSDSRSTMDLLPSTFYTVVPPTLNPLIYSLRNKDVKSALGRVDRRDGVSFSLSNVRCSPAQDGPGDSGKKQGKYEIHLHMGCAVKDFSVPWLSGSETSVLTVMPCPEVSFCFVSIVDPYARIFWAVLRMPAAEG
ncbi:olfactory receptor 14A16-like, partial [Tachyglossus aculeatus]|uniref:olfactory receptor 14A16-like n=1 Tax=Tachyglossus aculeatus TaxID=9261 RepID=UPI0018F6F975